MFFVSFCWQRSAQLLLKSRESARFAGAGPFAAELRPPPGVVTGIALADLAFVVAGLEPAVSFKVRIGFFDYSFGS